MKHPAEGPFSQEGRKKVVHVTILGSLGFLQLSGCAAATPRVGETQEALRWPLRSPVFAPDLRAGIISARSLLGRYAAR